MSNGLTDAFLEREAQWIAFQRWKTSIGPSPISLEERIAWYSAAFRFSRKWSAPMGHEDLLNKVKNLQERQRFLAYLRRRYS